MIRVDELQQQNRSAPIYRQVADIGERELLAPLRLITAVSVFDMATGVFIDYPAERKSNCTLLAVAEATKLWYLLARAERGSD